MSLARVLCSWAACAAAVLSVDSRAAAPAADLLITGAKPDQLFLIDAATRTIRAEHHIAGTNGQIFTIALSPDQRIAYLLVDRMERILGVETAYEIIEEWSTRRIQSTGNREQRVEAADFDQPRPLVALGAQPEPVVALGVERA